MTPDDFTAAAAPAAASPRISVIMPSYNSAPFLREALTSVLDQIPRPHEVLVQDGGSTDDTLDILRSFGDRVAWVSAPDDGQSDALNRALAPSKRRPLPLPRTPISHSRTAIST
jgi:cellulose synthase/poly-beta-1,6-N-acetylglucosamine synthase-like glycosyltransferase